MGDVVSAGFGAARALPLVGRIARLVGRRTLAVRRRWWLSMLAIGLIGGWALTTVVGVSGWIPGGLLAAAAVFALARWQWVVRSAGGGFLIYVSEFSEVSTHAQVRAADVHRKILITKLHGLPVLGDVLTIRRLPPVSLKTAEHVLRRSPGWAVVQGDIVTAGTSIKWQAAMYFRIKAHSRYADTSPEGEPSVRMGVPSWVSPLKLRLKPDGGQPIEVLTETDFPASHAEGITAMTLALAGTACTEYEDLERVNQLVHQRWAEAPSPARALTTIADANLAFRAQGYDAARSVFEAALARQPDQHLMLHRHYAGMVSIACAHGQESPETWLAVTAPLEAADWDDPQTLYMRACALMGAGEWNRALEILANLDVKRMKGPLSPTRQEVLSAYVQAATLADCGGIEYDLALDAFRRSLHRHWRLRFRRPDLDLTQQLVWAWPHNYDGVWADVLKTRIDELADIYGLEAAPDAA